MITINVENEYDQLKSVILGSVYSNDKIPNLYKNKEQEDFIKIIEQSNNELLNFQSALETYGVKVLRPTQPDSYHGHNIVNHEPLINMRDFYLAYKNIFFTTNSPYHERRYQHLWLEKIINQLILDGNLIINSNEINYVEENNFEMILHNFDEYFNIVNFLKPKTLSHLKNFKKYLENTQDYKFSWLLDHQIKNNNKNIFHTASILKNNKKCFISEYGGTDIGKRFITNWLNHLQIECIFVPVIGHLDSEISIINENAILSLEKNNPLEKYFAETIVISGSKEFYNKLDVSFMYEKNNPSLWFNKWQPLFKKYSKKSNVLSLNKNTIFVPFYDKEFFIFLKNKNINPIFIEWSNDVWWEGSLHCITCDLERRPE